MVSKNGMESESKKKFADKRTCDFISQERFCMEKKVKKKTWKKYKKKELKYC